MCNNFHRWLAEHNPVIARHSKAPSSPVLLAAVKDSMKSGLLDFRQSLRESGPKSQVLALLYTQTHTHTHRQRERDRERERERDAHARTHTRTHRKSWSFLILGTAKRKDR